MSPITANKRANSLDALRGFAILTMVLSGVIPYHVLPAWMYHAQIPPPSHTFNPNLPGLTWIDLVFPLFLFAMGAAIPLALERRLKKNSNIPNTIIHIFSRGFFLGFFAIFLRHVRPHVLNPNPDALAWVTGLTGFILLFAIFWHLPKSWASWNKNLVKVGAWALVVLLLFFIRYPDGSGFSLYRSDIIILVLANVYVFGALIWFATRNNILLRIGILAILLGLRLASTQEGWVQWVWDASPIPWLFKLDYLKYLFIVIPGTIIGDLYKKQISNTTSEVESSSNWSGLKLYLISGLILVSILTLLIGLQNRWLWQTAVSLFLLCTWLYFLTLNPSNSQEKFIQALITSGIFWLVLGLVFEPFEGGIKKDHSTLSYYFITTGISIFILVLFYIITDVFEKTRNVYLLIQNGRNPMLAYVGFANFIWPVFALLHLDSILNALTPSPWLGFLRGVFYTILLALMVSFLSKHKIFWKT